MNGSFPIIELVILLFFLFSNAGYFILNLIAWFSIRSHSGLSERITLQQSGRECLRPVTLIVPAWNEEDSVIDTVQSLQAQEYGPMEIVVVNDGSSDATVDVLCEQFDMEPAPIVYRDAISTAPVREVYQSRSDENLRLVDKENAGRFDAVNAGNNVARYPLVCTVDADSLLDEHSVLRMAQPFHEDEQTIASGGAVRVLNGCKTDNGRITEARLPDRVVPLIQVVEYLRAFQFGRMGWAVMEALLNIAGTWGMYRRDVVEEVGGFRDTVAEDMEMTTRLQHTYRSKGADHRISFSPDAFCWTEVPNTLSELCNQRLRWQRGVGDSLAMNAGLPFSSGAGTAGWLTFPFYCLFEFCGPLIELLSFGYFIFVLVTGTISTPFLLAFLGFSVLFGLFLSIVAILQEDLVFRAYHGQSGYTFWLLIASVLEHFGYRQILLYYRLKGVLQFFFHKRGGAYK